MSQEWFIAPEQNPFGSGPAPYGALDVPNREPSSEPCGVKARDLLCTELTGHSATCILRPGLLRLAPEEVCTNGFDLGC